MLVRDYARVLPALIGTEPMTDDPGGCRMVDGVEALPLPNLAPESGSDTACDNRPGARQTAALERIMPDLPSGTVTFLFTDIEGSTALWERDRTAMQTPRVSSEWSHAGQLSERPDTGPGLHRRRREMDEVEVMIGDLFS